MDTKLLILQVIGIGITLILFGVAAMAIYAAVTNREPKWDQVTMDKDLCDQMAHEGHSEESIKELMEPYGAYYTPEERKV